jgi:hypothetical protein
METALERAAGLLGNLYRDGALSRPAADALLASGDAPRQIAVALGPAGPTGEVLLATLRDSHTAASPFWTWS